MENSILRFDASKARDALEDLLRALEDPENAVRVREAREAAGTDMIKLMQLVFPLVTEIQIEVIQHYGFSGDGDGAAQFLHLVRSLEKEDETLSQLGEKVRSYFLPPMTPPVHTVPTSQP